MTTYDEEIKELMTDRLSRSIVESHYGEPIEKLQNRILQEEYLNMSNYYFQGDIAIIHPKITPRRALKQHTCNFSGALINKGSLYINYNCLIENLSNGSKYVLKYPLTVESGYEYDLPSTLQELEELNFQIINSNYFNGIDCSIINRQHGEILLRQLKR